MNCACTKTIQIYLKFIKLISTVFEVRDIQFIDK
jgi:hypothetical protein